MDIALRKMEEGARAAYAQDLCRNADISSQNHNRALAAAASAAASSSSGAVIGPSLPGTAGTPNVQDVSGTADPRGRRQVDPMALPMDPQELAELEARRLAATRSESGGVGVTGENPTLWCETVSEDGDTYYWNVKTNGEYTLHISDQEKYSLSILFYFFRNRLGETKTRLLDHGRVQQYHGTGEISARGARPT